MIENFLAWYLPNKEWECGNCKQISFSHRSPITLFMDMSLEAKSYVHENKLPFKRFLKSTYRVSYTTECGRLD